MHILTILESWYSGLGRLVVSCKVYLTPVLLLAPSMISIFVKQVCIRNDLSKCTEAFKFACESIHSMCMITSAHQ